MTPFSFGDNSCTDIYKVSAVAAMNSVQSYSTLKFTQRVYSGTGAPSSDRVTKTAKAYPSTSQVTPLSGRTFGTWTFLSAVIRFYAAYHIDNEPIYQLCFWTYILAFGHFASEWLVFGTARWGAGLAGPVIVSTASMAWMWSQWTFYLS